MAGMSLGSGVALIVRLSSSYTLPDQKSLRIFYAAFL
jgi:hypothetical protein